MKADTSLTGREIPQRQALRDHPSGSFLIRIWTEKREVDGEPPRVRVFLRNLKTGEEHYLGDLDQLGETVLRQFQHADPSAAGEEIEVAPSSAPSFRGKE
jgi:hypothetical protein